MFAGTIATTTTTTFDPAMADQVRRHGRLFFRLAYGVLRDAAAAEDVCQQAILKAWERRHEVRDAAACRGWVARIVLNESLQVRRRLAIERRVLARHASSPPPAAQGAAAGFEVRESVLAAMEKLPDTTRLVVAMRVMQGMSGNEVKDVLGCSAAEVSRQLHRGMELLRQSLAEWQQE